MPVANYGTATDSLASLPTWAAAVSSALDGSDVTVNTRLAAKAPLASPTFTGAVTLPSDVRGWGTNLLTTNQASVETNLTGFAITNASNIDRSVTQTYVGAASLIITSQITGASFAGGTPRPGSGTTIPVTAGVTYTASARVLNAVGSRSYRLRILWWNAAGGNVGDTGVQTPAISVAAPASWQALTAVGVAPATATQASVEIDGYTSGAVGDAVYVDALGFWIGAGGVWAMPGMPISPTGTFTDESVGRRIFTWDALNSRWQMTYSDTGGRNVTAGLLTANGFTGVTAIQIRRTNNVVIVNAYGLTRAASGNQSFYSLPVGFQPFGIFYGRSYSNAAFYVTGSTCQINMTALSDAGLMATFTTIDAWPTSLPGTAAGGVPQ